MKAAYRSVTFAFLLTLANILGLTVQSFSTVTRNPNGTYTARVSVNCAGGGSASKSATGNTPLLRNPPPAIAGCNPPTSAHAQRVVGTGEIIENATAARGDRASAGSFSLALIGVPPYATANLTMQETDVSSTQADFLINWKGDLVTAGQVQWTDFLTNNSLDVVNFAGGTSQSQTVDITDPNRLSNIGLVAEVDAASIAPQLPEPSSLRLLGSALIGTGAMLRARTAQPDLRRRISLAVRRKPSPTGAAQR